MSERPSISEQIEYQESLRHDYSAGMEPASEQTRDVQPAKAIQSLSLCYELLRLVVPERRRGCLCDECLRALIDENTGHATDTRDAYAE